MEKIKQEDLEFLTKESLIDKFLRLQGAFLEAMDALKPLQDFAEKLPQSPHSN